MKIYTDNGVYLGKVDYVEDNLWFFPNRPMSEYMLEEALRIVKKIKH
ncbi:MAG: hypothetical protein ACOCRK_11200 [bacterium]